MTRLLIVDDEETVARRAAQCLSQAGCDCEIFPTGQAVLAAFERRGAEVIVAGAASAGHGGVEILHQSGGRRAGAGGRPRTPPPGGHGRPRRRRPRLRGSRGGRASSRPEPL